MHSRRQDKRHQSWQRLAGPSVGAKQVLKKREGKINVKNQNKIEMELRNELAKLRKRITELEAEVDRQKCVEETLREYQRATEGSKDMIAVVDKNYNYLLTNDAFLKYRGMAREQVMGRTVPELLGEDVFKRVVKKNLDACFQGEVVQYEMRYPYPESGEKDLLVSYFPIEGPDGVNRVVSVIRDITELKQIVNDLQTEKQRFQTLSENAPFGMVKIDKDGTFRYVNPKFKELFGYDLNDVPDGRTWFRKAYPDATYRHEVIFGWINDLERTARGEKTGRVFTVKCKDGTEKIVNFTGVLLENGKTMISCEDITERKRAEEALSVERERFQVLCERSPIGVMIVAENGTLKYLNPKLIELFGYDLSDIPDGKAWLRKAYPDPAYRHHVISCWNSDLESFKKKEGRHKVFKVTCKDGTEKIFDFMSVQLEAGEYAVLCEDITDRLRGEEALRESEEKYRVVVENAKEAIFVAQDRVLKFVNRAAEEISGYSRGELTSRPFIDFVHPDDREMIIGNYQKRLRGEALPLVYSFRVVDRDGKTLWVEVNAVVITWNGGPAALYFFRDITERKQAEEALRSSEMRYRTILENTEEGYYEVDLAGNLTFFNDSVCRLYGYPREELIGMNNRQYTSQDTAKKVFQEYNQVYKTGIPRRLYDFELVLKDGSKRYVEVSILLQRDSSGEPIGFRGIVRDITERKRADEEMKSLQEQLRQSQKIEAIGLLAGGIAHDFGNLLAIIQGYSELALLKLPKENPVTKDIEEVTKAGLRAKDLIGRLLAFSRRQIFETSVLDLNAILRDLEKMLRRIIGEDIELVTLLASDLGKVEADPGQIEQILLNLAVNAKDAMPSGGKLTIETTNIDLDKTYARSHTAVKPGCYVMVSVSDTGIGMTPEVKERVFEPFFTTKEIGKGTGLGLSTVYGIVKQSGGNIWAYSEPGYGTTFKIYLPRVDETLKQAGEKKVLEELPRGNETVLVVEDEENVLKLVLQILKEQGYNALEAPRGSDAMLISEQHEGPIHLMVTDVVMPGMNGQELAKRLAPFRPEMKVLYMSAYPNNTIVHHGVLEKGANFIQKPFTVAVLARKVRQVLDSKI